MDPGVGHLNGIWARIGGNLNNNFQKSQMPGGLPGGGMLKLRFDRYITSVSVRVSFFSFQLSQQTCVEINACHEGKPSLLYFLLVINV